MGPLSERDEGKRVVHGDETVGRVIAVEDGTPYVEPDPSITDTLLAKLGWADIEEETFRLQEVQIERVTDDAVHLSESL